MIGFDIHKAKSEDAHFLELLREYQEPLYWHLRRLTGCHEDAQDALQETFLRVYQGLSRLERPESEKAWIYRIATNEALRLIERRPPTTDADLPEAAAGSNLMASESIEAALAVAIEMLPPRQRAVFCMRYYDDMDYPEIATALLISVANATANYHYAKEKIRKYLLSL